MWILPTRSRVLNFKRATENYPQAPVLAVFTENDPQIEDLFAVRLPQNWKIDVAPPDSTVPQILNRVFEQYPEAGYYGFIGDDVIPPKDIPWWAMLSQAAGDVFLSYPTDSIHGLKGAPHFALGGDLVRATGWLAAPWFYHNFIDTTWYYLAKELGLRRPVPDVVFQHLHPLDAEYAGLDDEIYKKGRGHYKDDEARFKLWMTPDGILKTAEELRGKLCALYSNSAK